MHSDWLVEQPEPAVALHGHGQIDEKLHSGAVSVWRWLGRGSSRSRETGTKSPILWASRCYQWGEV